MLAHKALFELFRGASQCVKSVHSAIHVSLPLAFLSTEASSLKAPDYKAACCVLCAKQGFSSGQLSHEKLMNTRHMTAQIPAWHCLCQIVWGTNKMMHCHCAVNELNETVVIQITMGCRGMRRDKNNLWRFCLEPPHPWSAHVVEENVSFHLSALWSTEDYFHYILLFYFLKWILSALKQTSQPLQGLNKKHVRGFSYSNRTLHPCKPWILKVTSHVRTKLISKACSTYLIDTPKLHTHLGYFSPQWWDHILNTVGQAGKGRLVWKRQHLSYILWY